MRRIFLIVVALMALAPQAVQARVPPSMLKDEGEQAVKSKYRETKKRLKSEGYKKNVFGLGMGYIKEGFALEPGRSVYVAPVKSLVREQSKDLVSALEGSVVAKTAELLKETELFSEVTTKDKKADYSLEIYVMEAETMFNIWTSGSRVVWGVNLYDADRNLLMAGYDKISSDAYSDDVRFLAEQMPDRAVLFVCRSNPEFNAEYRRLMRTRKFNWKIWER